MSLLVLWSSWSKQVNNFCDPNLVTFYLCIYLILNKKHQQYKHSGTFANCLYEQLSYPKKQKICDPIPVTLLKMGPHYSHSSRENATPSSGTSSLASYKGVPSPGLPVSCRFINGKVRENVEALFALKKLTRFTSNQTSLQVSPFSL